ncbi:MAG TPA: hypothetical protein DD381_00115 [Lentisphaeria bacterium]|nr:MAG: hypothetical protein A2X47_12925 [Lentisphaerae bacterium GWF2_38_69]HBM14746.1 hypothetical protein [Lentisphaeria bacterium]
MSNKILLTFNSTRDVILAEKECKKNGFECIAVPTPREYSSRCGIALEVPITLKEVVIELMKKTKRPFSYYLKN